MRSLVALRKSTPYDPSFFQRSPLFAPLRASIGRCLVGRLDFPEPEALDAVFDGDPPVHFVPAPPKPRRERRPPPDARALYDGTITHDRRVPTRPRSWHDLMNALVWGAFPRAKAALHERQHRAIAARIEAGARSLPPTRTRELDALALLDEGGVVLLADPAVSPGDLRAATPGRARGHGPEPIVFGHAIYESLALGVPPARVAALVAPRSRGSRDEREEVDAFLDAAIRDPTRFASPTELARFDLSPFVSCSVQAPTVA